MNAKPDDDELVRIAGAFHRDTFDEDGKPDPPRPWGKIWRAWLEAKAEAEKPGGRRVGRRLAPRRATPPTS